MAGTVVWVNNLDRDMAEDDFKAFASKSGTVTSVEIGRRRGMAWVTYESTAAADAAVAAMNGADLSGRTLKAEIATRDPTAPPPPKKERAPRAPREPKPAASPSGAEGEESYKDRVIARNLVKRSITDDDIIAHFGGADAVVKVSKDRRPTRIRFATEAAAAAAVALSGSKVGDSEVTVEYELRPAARRAAAAAKGGAAAAAKPAGEEKKGGRREKKAAAEPKAAAEKKEGEEAAKPRGTRSVTVSGLAAGTTGDALKAYFAGCGRVESAAIAEGSGGTEGSLTFDDPSGADKAVALSGSVLGGSKVTVALKRRERKPRKAAAAEGGEAGAGKKRTAGEDDEEAAGGAAAPAKRERKPRKLEDRSAAVWVLLAAEAPATQLEEAFKGLEGFTKAVPNKSAGKDGRRWGYVYFGTPEQAAKALALNGKDGMSVEAPKPPKAKEAEGAKDAE